MGLRVGIDVGGTKIEGAALGADGCEVADRVRVATPRWGYEATIATIVDVVGRLERAAGAAGGSASVGVGMPGAISPATGRVKNANSTWLNGRPFDADLAAALARPIRVENDANCLAVSEAVDGAGAGCRVVFAVILGTGCGGGIAIDGVAWRGRNAVAGEWGHAPLPWPDDEERDGPACWCGRRGCMEAWVSGPAFAAEFERATGVRASGEAIVARAAAGEVGARDAVRRLGDRIGRGLAAVVDVLDPDVVVLGGGLSRVEGIYAPARAALATRVFSDVCTTPIVPARHGDASGARGAAALWPPT